MQVTSVPMYPPVANAVPALGNTRKNNRMATTAQQQSTALRFGSDSTKNAENTKNMLHIALGIVAGLFGGSLIGYQHGWSEYSKMAECKEIAKSFSPDSPFKVVCNSKGEPVIEKKGDDSQP